LPQASNRRRRDPEASRQRILEAGVSAFAERGPDAASVADIADRAGLNRRMVYHYFGDKEGLYEAAIRYAYEQISSVEVELSHMLLPAESLLEKMIRAYYHFLASHPDVVRLLTWENLRHGEVARRIDVSSFKAPIIEALRVALARGRQEGRFRNSIDERQLLISCMALSFFYFSNRHTVGQALGFDLTSQAALDRRVRHVVRLLLEGIRADSGSRPAEPSASDVA
jgi:TetR/AcrR family transcriptional regulator